MTSKDKPTDLCLSKDCTRVRLNVRGKNVSGIVMDGKTTRSFCLKRREKKTNFFVLFFIRNFQKRAGQFLAMQILVNTQIHTEHWFYRHINQKSPLSCANNRNLRTKFESISPLPLTHSSFGSLFSQRSQKKVEKETPLPRLPSEPKNNKKDHVSTRKMDLCFFFFLLECVT